MIDIQLVTQLLVSGIVIGSLPIRKEMPPIAPRALGVIDGAMVLIAAPPITKRA